MDKSELKKVLKPLIKACIKEVIFEDGVLSSIISEVVRGTSNNVVVETKQQEETSKALRKEANEARNQKIQETRKKMADALGNDAYAGIFENVEPLKTGGTTSSPSTPANPLSGYAADDSGVDIRGLLSVAGDKWGKLRG
jgi:hypothetical protein